jgi:hypothetical protein
VQVGPGFNRDYWARFEKFVKDAVKVGAVKGGQIQQKQLQFDRQGQQAVVLPGLTEGGWL